MFRLFGFDVRVGTGFVIFLALIVFLYQDAFGFWLARRRGRSLDAQPAVPHGEDVSGDDASGSRC